MEICPVYVSKINSNCEKQKIILMIPNEEIERWDYLPVEKLLALLRGITLTNNGDFFVCIIFTLLEQKINLIVIKS